MIHSKLDHALKYPSKKRQKPFVIAHDYEKVKRFVAFDDIDHFLRERKKWPYANEIVVFPKDSDESRGRIFFDFDGPFDAPKDFRACVEKSLKKVFSGFYEDVDLSEIVFVWQKTYHDHKFSEHLILKNTYVTDFWKHHMTFIYTCMEMILKGREDILKYIDHAVIRRNSMLRMIGSKKIGSKEIVLESPKNATFFDCLIGIYRFSDRKREKTLKYQMMKLDLLEEMAKENKIIKKRFDFITFSVQQQNYNVSEEEYEKSIELVKNWENDQFTIKGSEGCFIYLSRVKPGPCPISGKVHESENACFIISKDGKLRFYCYRNCCKNRKTISIGYFKCVSKLEKEVSRVKFNFLN